MNNDNATNVSVTILDRYYLVSCPEGSKPELVQAAKFLDTKMREIRLTGKVAGLERIAIMAALNIAHQLLTQHNQTGVDSHSLVNQIHEKLDAALNEPLTLDSKLQKEEDKIE